LDLLNYFKGDTLAADVWKAKYADKKEVTPDDMHKRLAKEFAKIENNYIGKEHSGSCLPSIFNKYKKKLSEYGKSRKDLDEQAIYNLFKDFKYIIPQGSIMATLGTSKIASLSNCFLVDSPKDSYGGILKTDEELAQLMKRRGGVGVDLSTLRPATTEVNNAAGSSTGVVSFMERYSNTTREVAQDGRRGALMLSIDVNHPDILEFTKIKRDLTKVTGANISIKLNKEFMNSVKNNEDYILRFPCDGSLNPLSIDYRNIEEIPFNELIHIKETNTYYKKIKAKELWDEIIKSAHGVAEPGLMFWDNMIEYSPDGVYSEYKPLGTNPCGEIPLQPYDACRLMAINLYSFVKNPFTKDAKFNYKKLYEVAYEQQRLADDLIDLELIQIDKIIDKIHKDPEPWEVKEREFNLWNKIRNTAKASRRTGCGGTALGDALAALNLKYDSDEALKVIEEISKTKMKGELDCTIDLAILREPFDNWNSNLEYTKDFKVKGNNSFYTFIAREYPEQYSRMLLHGRRNVSWSTYAPTGTVSLMTQTSSGIEPVFMAYYKRRKKINPNDKDVRVDFVDQNGDSWQEYFVVHPKFKDWYNNSDLRGLKGAYFDSINWTEEGISKVYKESPYYNACANDIDWTKRVEIQSIIQKYTTHSISSTINLPEDVSLDSVSKIYLKSYELGLKGITVYRDGSRSGVLVSNKETKDNQFKQHDAPKRPKQLKAEAHSVRIKGELFNVLVGLYDDKPYEIFCTSDGDSNLKGEGTLTKQASGKYCFKLNNSDLDNCIVDTLTDEQETITRLVSTSLRHGSNIKFIVEQLNKTKGDLTSYSKAISRILKRYISDDEEISSKETCDNCGSTNLVREEGCLKCADCGSSKC